MANDAPTTPPVDDDLAGHEAFVRLTRRERRHIIGTAMLRMLFSIALLVAVYVLVAPQDLASGTLASGLGIAIILLALLVGWELYRTVRDPYPEVRAATSLMVLVTAVIIVFALIYASLSAANPAAFSEALGKEDAIYFTVTTLSTTGFGDITAISGSARWVVTAQMIFDLVLLVGLARVFMLVAKAGRAKRSRKAD